MLNTLYSTKQCNVRTFLACFNALVKPILMYGCELWAPELLGTKKSKKFLSGQNYLITGEKLEMKLLKYLLGVPRGASNIGVRCEMSNTPLRIFATSQTLKFYYRLKLGCENRLVQDVFKTICDNTINPFSEFLTLLVDSKITLPSPTERKSIKRQTQKSVEKLIDHMYDIWDQEILLNKKLEIFDAVKESHDPDFYIHNIDDRYARKYLAMLRLSTHPLKIETGRYTRILRQNRTCDFCNIDVIENEAHFMTCCTMYSNHTER